MALLEGRAVTKRFGGLAAVEELDFALEMGEIVGLIGPNGAGKTTPVNLISGLLRLDRGQIELDGQRLDNLPPHQRSRLGVAQTFQIVKPFRGLTVRQNVLVGALFGHANGRERIREAMRRAEETLELVGLAARADQPAEHLTIPDKKRMELARALATRPRVLLLDEVMSGLTPTEVDELLRLVQLINDSGVTILLIEHVGKSPRWRSRYILG